MSERARELADRFERVAEAFAAEVERFPPERWRAFAPEEGRTVAALAQERSARVYVQPISQLAGSFADLNIATGDA